MEHEARYRRAQEFTDTVFGLWDSWEDDAFVRDKQSGRYFDPAKLHTLHHRGAHFAVKGPLNVARPIQGYPVIAQAGSSASGQDLAGGIAALIYPAQKTKEGAVAFYTSVKAHGEAAGREPATMLVMPGVLPIMGRTRQEARDRHEKLVSLVHPRLGLPFLADTFGDLSKMDLDGPLPPPLPGSNALKSAHEATIRLARQPGMTIRTLAAIMAGAQGHNIVVGTPADVADLMEDWFRAGACDGWNVMPPFLPGPAEEVFGWLAPELRRRGLTRTEPSGDGTLRASLGLPRPAFRSRGRATATVG
jgi:alkanesulfonate monooxygenase